VACGAGGACALQAASSAIEPIKQAIKGRNIRKQFLPSLDEPRMTLFFSDEKLAAPRSI
jgi:hypothetical protein